MRILITGVGGAAAISVWKSLHQDHELYMADIDPCASGLYLVPAGQRFIIPRGDAPDFVSVLLTICQQQKIELLIATVDSELAPLANANDQFAVIGVKVPLCAYEVLKCCHDKFALLTHCLNNGKGQIQLPEFTLLTENNWDAIHDFPRFAKPRFGAGSNGVMMINNQSDLARLPRNESYLVQELLPGDEYSVDTYINHHGEPIAAVPRLRMKVDSGVAVTSRTAHIPMLSTLAITVAQVVGIRFVANIQFKMGVDGYYKLLEINPRFSGALPLTTAAGVDIPKLLVDEMQGKSLPHGLLPFKDLMVVRYWTEHFISPTEWEAMCKK